MSDNSYLQLLSLGKAMYQDSEASTLFKDAVVTHAHMFDSLKHHHVDDVNSTQSSEQDSSFNEKYGCIPAKKSTMAAFSETELNIVVRIVSAHRRILGMASVVCVLVKICVFSISL